MSSQEKQTVSGEPPCPLCARPLYPWILLPAVEGTASVGVPLPGDETSERVVERCENCGVAVERGHEVDVAAEWSAVLAREEHEVLARVPNRGSFQAAIGVQGWAAIELSPGALIHTRRSLELLAQGNDRSLVRLRTPGSRRSQAWMWQTLVNGLTFHPNFASEVRAGRLSAASARSRPRFYTDLVVSALAAPLVALLSVPLELIATALRRGGELVATVEPTK